MASKKADNGEIVEDTTTAVVPNSDAGALAPYASTISADALDIIRENMGPGASFDMLSLPRVRIPTGGSTSWQQPTVDGVKNTDTITGVIAHMTPVKGYWATSFEREPNQPPSCSSRDGIVGFGYRGPIDDAIDVTTLPDGADARYDANGNLQSAHLCETCPLNAFGTKANADGSRGQGKACKDMRALFVVEEGNVIPSVVMLSPMSIKPQGDYFLALAGVARRFWQVETALTLTRATNRAGIAYARAAFARSRNLEPSEIERMASYRTLLLPAVEAAFEPVTPDDRDIVDTEA